MAENKKGFVLYCDLIHTIEKMPSDKAGELFKHILRYVNDKEPDTDDLVVQLTFEPIKQQLKRDLLKYESIKIKRSEAGKKSAEIRNQASTSVEQNQQVSTSVESVEQTSTNPTVIDTVTVTVKDTVKVTDTVTDILLEKETKKNIFRFKEKLIAFGLDENLVSDWLTIRKNKKASNTKTAFESLESEFLKCENELNIDRNTALKYAVESSWSGFKCQWIKNEQLKNSNNGKQQTGRISNEQRLDDIFNGGKYDHLI